MATTSIYLNFPRTTEAAFTFYQSVFGGEFVGGLHRMGEVPAQEGQPPLTDEDRLLTMHVALALPGGVMLMGTDAPESMGFTVNQGNNMYINLQPDTRAEADRLFAALIEGGRVEMPMQVMFWGDYYGSLVDRFGIQWMVNCSASA